MVEEKITDMLQSKDKEMVELGVTLILEKSLKPYELNIYLDNFIKHFHHYWGEDGEGIVIVERGNVDSLFVKDPTRTLKLIPMKYVDHDIKGKE